MCIVKDLLTREELRHVKRTLELLSEDTPVSYEVWAISNTEQETLLRRFDEASAAVYYANTVNILETTIDTDIDYVTIEVETVIDDMRGSTISIGTIFKNNLFVLEHIG